MNSSFAREFSDDSGEAPVRGFLHFPDAAPTGSIVLTHGAGANCNAPLLVALAEAFSGGGVAVLRCDLPFRQARPSGPPPRGSAERDQQGLWAAVESIRREVLGREAQGRVFLGGHSYGGRQASMLAAAEPTLAPGLLLLSYPLHPPQRPAEMRTAHFPRLTTPALFVSGTRDGFGSVSELEEALKLIPARTRFMPIEGAGHELLPRRNRQEFSRAVVVSFLTFAR
jgi:uncharacterized protein